MVDVERYALTGQLETLEQARQLLELADSPQEVKRVAEFAEAMRHVAKQAKLGLEAQNEAAEMKIHAQIKGGEMLAGMVSRGNFKKSSRSTFQLDEIGVSKYESSTWQKLSAGDHAKIQAKIDEIRTDGHELTTAAILKYVANMLGEDAERSRRRRIAAQADVLPDNKRWLNLRWEEYIPTLADGSISLLLTDPPYGMEYNSGHRIVRHRVIENDDEATALADLEDMLHMASPKLAKDAHVVVFTSPRLEPAFRDVIEKAGYTLRSYPVWAKNNTSMGDLGGTFAPKHERLIHAAKGDPKMVYRAPDVFSHARVLTENHPTEKPVPLLKELIEATTVEGEAVLDPYGGVGSTLGAAEECGRIGLGCEVNFDYHAYGLIRLKELLVTGPQAVA